MKSFSLSAPSGKMPRGQTIKMLYEQQEKQKQILQMTQNLLPAPSYEVSISTSSDTLLSNSLMSQFIQPQLLSPPHQSVTAGTATTSTTDEEFAGQTVTYVPLHQVASTFSEVVDVAGMQRSLSVFPCLTSL